MKIFYFMTIIGSILGGLGLFAAFFLMGSAPQQGAAAAIAVGFGVLPYVCARAVEKLGTPD